MLRRPNKWSRAEQLEGLGTSQHDQSGLSVPQRKVIVCDDHSLRRGIIGQIVNSCGAISRDLPYDVDCLDNNAKHGLALVALGKGSLDCFRAIQTLKAKGLKIISYEDDLFSWPIGIRCRALLSGAFLLLDSAATNFAEELKRVLIENWTTETELCLQEEQIKQQMKDLGIIGESIRMISVFRWVERVSALSDFPVLIHGETGTGKELIANALHRLDRKRSTGPFVAANCSAISSGLAESELFGHRKGAFTGADSDRKGLFRSADGGVLFLDEVGDLSQSLQAKLLRVLQEDRVLGVGFDREIAIDVRVIAATNKNLEIMVREGHFREDLYHRLNGVSITIPPLRDRPEDLRPLTEHFLEKYSSLSSGTSRLVSPEFLDALRQIRLSGNVRQLENIIRRALLNPGEQTPLGLRDLTPTEWQQLSEKNQRLEQRVDGSNGTSDPATTTLLDHRDSFLKILDLHDWNLSKALEYCERSLLECALEFTNGNQSRTARLIGITPRSVYNKVHKHKLNS